MDDRPVTSQLPVMLGRIAGVRVEAPPRDLIGRFLDPGHSDDLIAWLNREAAKPQAGAFVVSTDMLAYGGLTASRVPGPSYADAVFRLRALAQLRLEHPGAWIGAFGTIMRLAPPAFPPARRSSLPIPSGRICSNMPTCTILRCPAKWRARNTCAN